MRFSESAFVGSVLSFESFQREFGLLDKTESERAVLDASEHCRHTFVQGEK